MNKKEQVAKLIEGKFYGEHNSVPLQNRVDCAMLADQIDALYKLPNGLREEIADLLTPVLKPDESGHFREHYLMKADQILTLLQQDTKDTEHTDTLVIEQLKAQLKAKDKLISSKDSWLQSFNQDFMEKDKIISNLKQEIAELKWISLNNKELYIETRTELSTLKQEHQRQISEVSDDKTD
jgi:hypothetical protein